MTDTPRKRPVKRAAKRTVKEPPLAEVTELPQNEREPLLVDVLNEAVKHMDWLKPSDESLVELCREYCRRIDETKKHADDKDDEWFMLLRELGDATESKVLLARLAAVEAAIDVTKVVAWVGPHLTNALRAVGGAPGERKGLNADAPVQGQLAALRGQAARRKPTGAR